jgi:hypothetical protein
MLHCTANDGEQDSASECSSTASTPLDFNNEWKKEDLICDCAGWKCAAVAGRLLADG